MASITLDGATCTRASVLQPRLGAWTADVALDAATGPAIGARTVLSIDGSTWSGTVVEGGAAFGAWSGRLVGGAGGLRETLQALPVRGATLALVLSETLREAGETQASGCGDLSAVANWWARLEAPAGSTVAEVARVAGYAWRVLPAGTVWLGAETWATHTPAGAVDVVEDDPRVGRLALAGDVLGILPGQTLALARRTPVRVGCVEHQATPAGLRTVVLVERETATAGRLLEALEAVVRRITRRVDYLALYPARVLSQHTDGTLDVQADDSRVSVPARIPYRTLRGVALTVAAGARVLVAFEAGDPSKPVALLWELGNASQIALNGGSLEVARRTDSVSVTIPTGAVMVPAPGPMPPAGTPIPSHAPITCTGTITSGVSSVRA